MTAERASLDELRTLVDMVADGTVPREEVRAFINRPRTTDAKQRRLVRKCLRAARAAAAKVDDPYTRCVVFTALYRVTKDPRDLTAAGEFAPMVKTSCKRFEVYTALYGVAKNPGDLTSARAAAEDVGVDPCWQSLAYTKLTALTSDPADLIAAREAAVNVDDATLRVEAFTALGAVSGDSSDFTAAREAAARVRPDFQRCQVFAVLYQATKDPRDLTAAREAAAMIPDENALVRFEAFIYLVYPVTKDPTDLAAAQEAADRLTIVGERTEARQALEDATTVRQAAEKKDSVFAALWKEAAREMNHARRSHAFLKLATSVLESLSEDRSEEAR